MNKWKKLYLLLGVLVLACGITFWVSRQEEKKEKIKNSDEIIFSIDTDSVTALGWEYAGNTFSFRKSGGTWIYDADENFPVKEEKIESLLSQFTEFGASFVIEEVEDFGQYGLSEPLATIRITAGEDSYEVNLGDYSTMDAKRYVSVGDGRVYLVKHDPLDEYDLTIRDLIQNDEIPALASATGIRFEGDEDYTIAYEEDGNLSYCAEDVYFTDGKPLDTSLVNSYLQQISNLTLTDYVTYNASEEELQACGLNDPELSVTVDYTETHSDDVTTTETFVLHVGRDAEETAALNAEEASAEKQDASDAAEKLSTVDSTVASDDTEVTAYVRVGDSSIIYRITSEEYRALTAASYDDLRHKEVLTASMEDITGLNFTIGGETYTLGKGDVYTTDETDNTEGTDNAEGTDGAENTGHTQKTVDVEETDTSDVWTYQGKEIDVSGIEEAISALSADSFTEESPKEKEEIRFTAQLNNASFSKVEVVLYRYDGEHCLATVNGTTVSLIPRSQAVNLIEAVNAIVLN